MSNAVNNQPLVDDDVYDFTGMGLPYDKAAALKIITSSCIENIDPDDPPEPQTITNEILGIIKREFAIYNKNAEPGTKWQIPSTLPPQSIAQIMLKVYHIRNVNFTYAASRAVHALLCIYMDSGENEGIYIPDESVFRNLARMYNDSITLAEMNHVMQILKDSAERVVRCSDPDLIPLNNGIFNYKTKVLEPFSPDIVFTSKSHTNYNPVAKNIVIHNDEDNTDWDVESWMKELFDDPDRAELIWQIIGACIRCNVRWDKAAFFYSVTGNNGKGTICLLIRNLIGTCVSISLDAFGEEFMLEQLIGATCVITDENDVGSYLEKLAKFKAVITNDIIQINRKHKEPVGYQFRGFMIQCVNKLPRIQDKSDSLYRRILLVPFDRCYTGEERKYIKDDYLQRQEVLEYVLYKVLNMNYYKLDEPDSCKLALEEFKICNDPVRELLSEVLSETFCDYLTNELLYELYNRWSRTNNPSGKLLGKNNFCKEVRDIFKSNGIPGWAYKHTTLPATAFIYDNDPVLNRYGINQYNIAAYEKKPGTSVKGLFREQPSQSVAAAGATTS